jgi:hypothetical protein
MLEAYHPEAEMDYRATLPDFAPTRGLDAMERWMRDIATFGWDVEVQTLRVEEVGPTVFIEIRLAGEMAGNPLTMDYIYGFTFDQNDLITHAVSFRTWDEALRARP